MSLALYDGKGTRSARLSVLVNGAEAEEIAHRAAAAGVSVSAYLRARALGDGKSEDEAAAMRVFDQVIDEMTARVDEANASLEAALARMEARPAHGAAA